MNTEEKMSPLGRLILFAVLAMVIFLIVLVEIESQKNETVNATDNRNVELDESEEI